MVKVLTHGGQNLGAIGRHFNYIDRDGTFPSRPTTAHR
jgi:hypothetical protein